LTESSVEFLVPFDEKLRPYPKPGYELLRTMDEETPDEDDELFLVLALADSCVESLALEH
jgi:hypothetical protein